MNGWQRLWVLVCVLLGIGAGLYGLNSIHTEKRITAMHEATITWVEMRLEEKAAGIKTVDPQNGYIGTTLTVDQLKDRIVQENKEYNATMQALPAEQWKAVATIASIWLTLCVGLYSIGWLVAWVIRGFRPKTV